MLEQDRIQLLLDVLEFLGVDHDLLRRALHARKRLMDHDAGIGQRTTLSFGPSRQQHSPHRGTLTDAVRGHVTGHELHGVVDRQTCRHAATRRVDIEMDVAFGIVRLEEKHLRDNGIGHFIVDLRPQKDNPVFEQTAVNIHRPLFTAALLNDVGNQRHRVSLSPSRRRLSPAVL